MIPFTDADGLRDYRAHVARDDTPRRRWRWLGLLLVAGLLLGLALRGLR